MALSSLMSVSMQALKASYRQVHTVGNNIANASTEGYSRQQAIQTPSMALRTGAGYVGTGVEISAVTRAANQFLQDKATTLKSAAAADQTTKGMLGQLELLFKGGEGGLGHAATQVFTAFADLAIMPSDLSARQAVLGRLDDFAALTRSSGAQLQLLQDNVRHDIAGSVSEVNDMARQVATLNREIQGAVALGQTPNELLDHRDLLVGRLAEHLDLQTFTGADGGMSVFVAGGHTLVLGGTANQLVAHRDALDPTRSSISVSMNGVITLLADHHITGGKLGGLVQFQNQDLAEAGNRLGQMVTALASRLNEQQGYGLDLRQRPGAALFDIPAPQALPATSNAVDALGRPISSVQLTVADAGALQPSDYELLADPSAPGSYVLTRLSDNLQRSGIVSGDVVDGLRITAGAVPPSGGERFLLRAVSHVPTSLALSMRDPAGIAAAGPVVATTVAGNTGSLAIAGVDIVAAPTAAYAALTLRFTDDLGNYELLGSGGALVGAGQWSAGQPIVHNGVSINVTGVPRNQDQVRIAPVTHAASNNGNALTFAGLVDQAIVDGQGIVDAYTSLFSTIGVRTQGARIAADGSGAAATNAAAELTAETGVNLDEEAARLIQYQQAYQASAKVLQSAQTMIDTLLGLTR